VTGHLDVLTIGRVGVDLYPLLKTYQQHKATQRPLITPSTFSPSPFSPSPEENQS